MLNYSINSDIRQKIIFFLAILSAGTGTLLGVLISDLSFKISIPSAFAIFGIYFWVFDNFLWKIPLIKSIHRIPNLNGKWTGNIKRSVDGQVYIDLPIKAEIQQTWSKIQIEVIGTQTRSLVISLSMELSSDSRKFIDYIYEVKPTLEGDTENRRGEGCQNLILENNDLLSGRFFSSKLRKGTLILNRNK